MKRKILYYLRLYLTWPVRYLLLFILILRLIYLRSKHRLQRLSKMLKSDQKKFFKATTTNSASYWFLFTWDNLEVSIKKRLIILIIGFFLCYIAIATKLLMVASTGYVNFRNNVNKNDRHRHDIVDRNGNLLAVNLPAASLFANPRKVIDPELSVHKLLKVFPNLDKKNLLAQLTSDKNFVWIKRDITPKEQEMIYNLGMPGFEFEREQKRIYTYGKLLSHVIGYVGRDIEGLAGIEKHFDSFLVGKEKNDNLASMGSSLQLSIDIRVQSILDEEIDKIVKKFRAKGAAGMVVDPNNGEIIALVSNPNFDPHYPGLAKPDEMFNMVTQGVYEMGSGMKALTLAIGIDTGVTTMQDVYDLTYMKVGKFKVKDYHPLKGWHTVPEIFLNSSNIGVSQIMLEVGKNNLRKYLKKLKLMDKLEIELPERARPLFPPYSRWSDLSLVTMSYGYGVSESPAHFLQAMIPVVNGGIMYPLTLLKRDSSSVLVGEKILKESTSMAMRQLMRLVVTEGTGKKAEVKGYYVGGKTGTANKAVAGKYDKDKRISSFFGVIPTFNPKYILYVIVNQPQGIKETFGFAGGGWTAAPVVGAVFERMVTLYGMKKIEEQSPDIQNLVNIEFKIKNET